MSIPTENASFSVALIGNPNTGKSTLFGDLVGVHQHVGNYPGVTVEKRTGRMEHSGRRYELVDLPGLYSLAPRSRDEMVAVDLLLGRRQDCQSVDAVICIVDAGNLQRNLYLVSQVLELGLPTIVAVNMIDLAKQRGVVIDLELLERQLGLPVVAIQANRRIGIPRLKAVLAEAIESGPRPSETPFPEPFEKEVTRLESELASRRVEAAVSESLPRCLVRRILLDTDGYLVRTLLREGEGPAGSELKQSRDRLAEADCPVPAIETKARYDWIHHTLDGVVTEPSRYKTTTTDRLDHLLTHRIWGTIVFGLLMGVVFQSVFFGGDLLSGYIDAAAETIGGWFQANMAEGALRSLLVDGIIGGVGSVLGFLPQILILFLFIAVLEDCGYMARAAYVMDKLMVRVGLSGKSFIPMLSCFACAIPGIMAARVIENERDRLTTILVSPLMTCSARLPVYALLIAAFIPHQTYLGGLLNLQGLTMVALYLLGIVVAVTVALVLKRTILRGQTPPFLMELPSYKWPSLRTAVYRVTQRGWLFLRCAGTLILCVSVIVWAALYFPRNAELQGQRRELRSQLDVLGESDTQREDIRRQLARIDGAAQRQSLLGRVGRVIEPAVKPLGWDWRIGCAVVASFPAREIVVATMGVIYNVGEDLDFESEEGATKLQAKLHAVTWEGSSPPKKVFNVPVALSILVFFALCAQCAATLVVIRRETNSWRWPAFTFAYMTTLAYLGALITYQVGTWIGAT